LNKTEIIEIGTGYTSIPAKVGAATEIVVEELTRASMEKGLDVVIFDISDPHRSSNDLPITEVPMPEMISGKVGYSLGVFHKMKRVWYSLSLARHLARHIRKNKSYILHFHNQYNFFFFRMLTRASRKKNVRLYYTNHTYTWSLPWDQIKSIVRKRYFMESWSMKKADLVFVLNENTVHNLNTYLNIESSRIRLIPNGVNTSVYHKLPEDDQTVAVLRDQLKIAGRRAFFHTGTVCDRKNQLEIIRYLTPVFLTEPDLIFLYAGAIKEPEYFAAIEEYCKQNNIEQNIRYLGELPPGKALNTYYNLAEAFLFFSKSEGFSLSMLEALSSGLPVLLSKNLEMSFIREKQNGILLFGQQEEFLSLLKENILCRDRQRELSGQAACFIQKNYSWGTIVDKYFPSES